MERCVQNYNVRLHPAAIPDVDTGIIYYQLDITDKENTKTKTIYVKKGTENQLDTLFLIVGIKGFYGSIETGQKLDLTSPLLSCIIKRKG